MKTQTKKILQLLLITALALGNFALPTFAQSSDGNGNPRFNIFTPYSHTQAYNQDYYLLDIKNDTKNGSFNDPVSADPGDILTFSVYYHNGETDTVANNTQIRISIPSANGTQIVSTAYLWADNAENATPNNPISEAGTVNLSSQGRLQYISGSAKWYPNQSDSTYNSSSAFPYGQTGNEIIANGVNLGSINGCWEYSGYINFQVRVIGYTAPAPVPEQPAPPPSKIVTGANSIAVSATEAASASGILIAALYFISQNFAWFAKLKLNGYSIAGKFGKTIF
jgi:hypothetical protein